jgi:hypothetical protein
MADSSPLTPPQRAALKPWLDDADREIADLRAARQGAIECAGYAAELIRWAKGELQSTDPNSGQTGSDFLVECLLQTYNNAQDAAAPALEQLASAIPEPPPAYCGVNGASYHAIAIGIGRKILKTAAEALGTIFIDGLNPETGKYAATVAGWREGFEIDPSTGLAKSQGVRIWLRLSETDFRQRLQAMPDFNNSELAKRIEKESALAADRRRTASAPDAKAGKWPAEAHAQLPKPEFIFAPDGDGYFVAGFGASGHLTAKGCKGLHHVFRLLKTPEQPVPMAELGNFADDQRIQADRHSKQPAIDYDDLQKLRERLTDAKANHAKAKESGDTVDEQHCVEEIEHTEAAIRQLTKITGEPRDLNNPLDRMRSRIRGTLKGAFSAMRNAVPPMTALADHLEQAIRSEAGYFIYSATPPIQWQLEKPEKKFP